MVPKQNCNPSAEGKEDRPGIKPWGQFQLFGLTAANSSEPQCQPRSPGAEGNLLAAPRSGGSPGRPEPFSVCVQGLGWAARFLLPPPPFLFPLILWLTLGLGTSAWCLSPGTSPGSGLQHSAFPDGAVSLLPPITSHSHCGPKYSDTDIT